MRRSSFGLVTFTSRQSSTSLKASREKLATRGVHFDLFHVTHKFSRRIWRYWRSPWEDLRCLVSLALGHHDFLLLNEGATLMRRRWLLRLLLLVARTRRIRTFVRWGSCSWLFDTKRNRDLGPREFEAGCRVISRPGIQHLTLTPESAVDLARATSITSSFVIYNCIALPDKYRNPVEPIDPPVVLNVATVQPRKGPDLFVDVAAEVCGQHPTVRFIWVGGRATEALTRQIKDYGLESRVEFVGRVMPPYEWMQRASVVFFSSRSEAFGLAVAEAMACYRTVCCFQGTGAEFVVGDTGVVIPRFDTSIAAQRITELLNRPSSDRVNQNARHRYDALFSPDSFAERLSKILREPQSDDALFLAPL